ncbi:MAG: lytic transglycosylase domain-containing protein [Silvibacterium sp.]
MLGVLNKSRWVALALSAAAFGAASAHAAEHITLTNGFDLICDHRAVVDGNVRLYLDPGNANFIEVGTDQIAASEAVKLPVTPDPTAAPEKTEAKPTEATPTEAELRQLLSRAGAAHDLDVDLLASVIREESGGHTRAVSRAGAEGLMQLMPGTAAELGVADAFAPGQNISGGTAYLDSLLKQYHENLALALAAYNAGPAAVDRWHGIPPFRETQLYVARVIHEFNRRIAARKAHELTQVASAVR